MVRVVAVFACLVALMGLLSGCATGTEGNINLANFAGTYRTGFTRATGTVTIAVETNGQITITITDSVEGNFVGTGVANHVGGFFITCNGVNNKQVSVNGTLRGSGLGRTAQGTIAGKISVDYNANFLSNPDSTIYTNHYEGRYEQGSTGNNWFGDVSSNGSFSGTLLAETGEVSLTGTVYSNGSFKFTGSAGGTSYEITGNFALSQAQSVLCNGIIKGKANSTTVSGNFSGHNAQGG